jgi:hypothetical protein
MADERPEYQQADLTSPALATIRINNANNHPAFVILLDPDFEKPGVLIDIPEMDDPTYGHPRSYKGFMESLKGTPTQPHPEGEPTLSPSWPVGGLYLWSPNLAANLDLYTMHCFDAGKQEGEFDHLRIIRPRLQPDQVRDDVVVLTSLRRHERFALSHLTRISIIIPAFTKMILELYSVVPDIKPSKSYDTSLASSPK